MTYAQIRTRLIERLGEYHAGAAETAGTGASFSAQTLYNRIVQVYRDMVGEIAEVDPEKVATTATMAYAAEAESATLAAGVAYTRILGVERLVGSTYEPLRRGSIAEERANRRGDALPREHLYRFERNNILIYPTPTSAETLRLRYVAKIAEIVNVTDDANAPDLIPEEFHSLMAMRAAASFKSEVGAVPFADEMAVAQNRFARWAASGENDGPRTVRMVDDFNY